MFSQRSKIAACVVFSMVLLSGSCGGDSNGNGDGNTTVFRGAFTGSNGEGGILEVTIHSGTLSQGLKIGKADKASTIPATGDFKITGGSTVTLTGSYNPTTKALKLSGSGYQLNASLAQDKFDGTYTSPTGKGTFSIQSTSGGAVTVFCGSYKSTDNTLVGKWNLVEGSSGVMTGSWTHTTGESGLLFGTLSGSNISLDIHSTSGDKIGTGTGSVNGDAVDGNWTVESDSGTWEGTTSGCK
jgi:hypothetical protein